MIQEVQSEGLQIEWPWEVPSLGEAPEFCVFVGGGTCVLAGKTHVDHCGGWWADTVVAASHASSLRFNPWPLFMMSPIEAHRLASSSYPHQLGSQLYQ
jgi:hypothetical protein